MRIFAIIAGLLVGFALTAAIAWNAAEAHYQGCVEAAVTLGGERTTLAVTDEQIRRVEGCSRLP